MTTDLRRTLASPEAFGFALFAFAAGFPPFDDVAEVDLSMHMLQHVIIVFAGILVAYPTYGRGLLKLGGGGWRPPVGLLASAALVLYWHLPAPWDAAVLDPATHVVEHLSFLLVGLLAGSWIPLFSDSGRIGGLFAAFFGHMGYAVLLIAPFGGQVYALYSLPNQIILGWILLLTGPLLLAGVAYVIVRNPDWLGGFSGPGRYQGPRRDTFLNRVKVPVWVAPACTAALIVASAGYFSATAYALGSSHPPTGGGPVVYIIETPISWQYSPQSTTVVLGLNATVVWISHSISYDTVTAREGTFDSGVISPGGTFSHTFTAAGTYRYYCQFHPWMTGTVTVLAGP